MGSDHLLKLSLMDVQFDIICIHHVMIVARAKKKSSCGIKDRQVHCRDHYFEIRCLQRQRTPSVVDGAPLSAWPLPSAKNHRRVLKLLIIAQPLLGDIIFINFLTG